MDHTGPGGQGAARCSKLTLCFLSAQLALGNSAAQEADARRAYGEVAVLVTLQSCCQREGIFRPCSHA